MTTLAFLGSPLAISDACTACGACLPTCPTHALVPAPRKPLVLAERCTLCMACVEVCPRGAIEERS